MTIIETIKAMPEVERVSQWQDRLYITLAAAYRSTYRGEMSCKLWIKGDVLTVERPRGTTRTAFDAAKRAVIDAVVAAGGTVREI